MSSYNKEHFSFRSKMTSLQILNSFSYRETSLSHFMPHHFIPLGSAHSSIWGVRPEGTLSESLWYLGHMSGTFVHQLVSCLHQHHGRDWSLTTKKASSSCISWNYFTVTGDFIIAKSLRQFLGILKLSPHGQLIFSGYVLFLEYLSPLFFTFLFFLEIPVHTWFRQLSSNDWFAALISILHSFLIKLCPHSYLQIPVLLLWLLSFHVKR